jgi:hypothetical protein
MLHLLVDPRMILSIEANALKTKTRLPAGELLNGIG